MNTTIEKYVRSVSILAATISIVWFVFNGIYDLQSLFDSISKGTSISILLWLFYEKWLWRFSPFEKLPRLAPKYYGKVKFEFQGKKGEKKVQIAIKQTLLCTKVIIDSDEMTSNTVISQTILENDEYVLYYSYITSPHGDKDQENPIRRGTCRIRLVEESAKLLQSFFLHKAKSELRADYWTNAHTTGTIELSEARKTAK